MSIYLEQIQLLLSNIDIKEAKQAKEELEVLTKNAGVTDLINDPKFQNIVNLLTPFVVNYKVNQVLKLLTELAKDRPKIDPSTGLRKYI
jgi:hypothetical protein